MSIKAQPKPDFLDRHSFKQSFQINAAIQICWDHLNNMDTFRKGQVFPYRVEFIQAKKFPSFETGVWTNHHGPLLNVCGQVGEMTEPTYRDLNYSYGSYVISFRLIRPVRLQLFFISLGANQTRIDVQLDVFVLPWLIPIWVRLQGLFWRGFAWSISRKLSC